MKLSKDFNSYSPVRITTGEEAMGGNDGASTEASIVAMLILAYNAGKNKEQLIVDVTPHENPTHEGDCSCGNHMTLDDKWTTRDISVQCYRCFNRVNMKSLLEGQSEE